MISYTTEDYEKAIENNDPISVNDVISLAIDRKIISSNENSKGHAILKILLDYPEGLCRFCWNEILFERTGESCGQSARPIATLRDRGIVIAKDIKKNCIKHFNKKQPFGKISYPYFSPSSFMRSGWNKAQRTRIISALNNSDAFTGEKFTSNNRPEIDHRIPVQRRIILSKERIKDIEIDDDITNEEIKNHFQLLTRQENLQKDRACNNCIKTGLKPTYFFIQKIGIESGGGEKFIENVNDCDTCPFAFPEKYGFPTKPINLSN